MNRPAVPGPAAGRRFPWTGLAALAVLALAASALIWPVDGTQSPEGLLLVVDPAARVRGETPYAPVAAWLSEGLGRPLRALVVPTLAAVPARAWQDVGLVLCPDRAALGLSAARFVTLAAARRQAPENLRPRSVLVRRRATGPAVAPWLTRPARTILGDTLSLAGCGVVCSDGTFPWRRRGGPAYGCDPFDHGGVLEALRAGCYDFALVREWTARRFAEAGLLPDEGWELEPVSVALPDVVVAAARDWPARDRVRAGELLLGLGRQREGGAGDREAAALRALARIDVDGFNLLLEPDFELVRRQFGACWPGGGG